MFCPACRQELNSASIKLEDKQEALVYECFNCGGHFFPPLIANFTPTETAKNLDSIQPKNLSPSAPSITCPICKRSMTGIKDDVVPKGVLVYNCPNNHGHFFPLRQLYAFKRAQKNKLEYHQIWGIPIKSAFAILLPVAAIFTTISVLPLTLDQVKQGKENRVKASDFITRPLVTPIDSTQVVISFSTTTPSIASLTLNTPNGPKNLTDSPNAQSTHVISITNLTPATPYTYTITANKETTGLYSFTTLSN